MGQQYLSPAYPHFGQWIFFSGGLLVSVTIGCVSINSHLHFGHSIPFGLGSSLDLNLACEISALCWARVFILSHGNSDELAGFFVEQVAEFWILKEVSRSRILDDVINSGLLKPVMHGSWWRWRI